MMQKDVQNNTPDTKTSFNVKMSSFLEGQNWTVKISLFKMLKWVRWGE